MKNYYGFILSGLLVLYGWPVYAEEDVNTNQAAEQTVAAEQVQIIPRYSMREYDQKIQTYYHLPASKSKEINQRVAAASEYFLGKKYLLGALGEGSEARFDKKPLYRTDAFDCFTFVSTVIALAQGDNLNQFKRNIQKVNYVDGKVSYVHRAHFTSVDWNPNNVRNGYLIDITNQIVDAEGNAIAAVAQTVIDKPAWFKKRSAKDLALFQPVTQTQLRNLLQAMHELSNQVSQTKGATYYLPLDVLFDAAGKPNQALFKQIPTGTVIEIVRPNWDLTKEIGTHLNVSHMGIALRTSQGLIYRNASSIKNQVVDVPLIEYLHGYLASPTIKGISVFKIVRPK